MRFFKAITYGGRCERIEEVFLLEILSLEKYTTNPTFLIGLNHCKIGIYKSSLEVINLTVVSTSNEIATSR